jgi:hypothetical protein
MDSVVLDHDVGGFRRVSVRIGFCLQLPHDLCHEFGSLAPGCLELRGIPKHLFALASSEATSASRSSFP